jgi:parallel beta-helix repeat protein
MRSVLSKLSLVTLTVGLISVVAVAPASAEHVQCGDTITQSTTLDSDIIDCAHPTGRAIEIDGTDITLDLGGHTVDGTGVGFGIHSSSVDSRVTVRGGHVREFANGISLSGEEDSTIRDLTVSDNFQGARVTGLRPVIEGVTATRNSTGISFGGSTDAVVRRNHAFANQGGMGGTVVDSGLIEDNVSHDNVFTGIGFGFLRSNTQIVRNVSTDNGIGILVAEESLDSTLLGNRVSRSGADGIVVSADSGNITLDDNRSDDNADDGIDIEGPGNTLTRNSAFRNFDYGIEAAPGTIDGGKNKARHNGNPAQCVGVICK